MSLNRIHPKSLFLIDSIGALATAFFLAVLLRKWNEWFGMPEGILLVLAAIAMVFCLYSFSCFLLLRENWKPWLRGIITANLLYCILTFSLLIFYWPVLTLLGVLYFLAEIMIICLLVYVEWSVMRRGKNER